MAVSKEDRDKLAIAGVALVSTGLVMGGMAWVIRRQIQSGDVLRVQLVHTPDPGLSKQVDELTGLLREYLPQVTSLADEGLDVQLRFKQRTP